ncbi:glycosyltransferase family 39 protein [Tilletiaria anomala UBC 951]|uniref:Dolichyl-phosphate-mannose--protein mannosyltransferase n=1 Tax=Tilletiaria anomala (strain ATCC 24038 / CBS 436.72 / UBC 951) TaxID=1037660 RepID=A0A066WCF7_TILAU|nr:glycosyltransferase family 39 protein [Tilletiaria anomala UBC 951]KDN48450.1 glycosyltransferase family 39 protein [Tilletiaria anomala UBC 951]
MPATSASTSKGAASQLRARGSGTASRANEARGPHNGGAHSHTDEHTSLLESSKGRKRGSKNDRDAEWDGFADDDFARKYHGLPVPESIHRLDSDYPIMLVLLAVAFAARFYKIWHPNQVVFDEVHFGKFAAYYLKREYFFDVHPPLAKLINALAGYLARFDGKFEFDNIGDKYLDHNVPYVKMRSMPALMGSLQVPLAYAIMRETGHSPSIACLSAAMILLDNAHIAQDRLILLDAALVLFMMCSLLSYIKFFKERYNEFSARWWFWMFATGTNLALTMSCKMVGLFTFLSIGSAVALDLWNLLDIRRGHSMTHISKHFFARVLGLIVWPACVYIFWFWVHFAILTKSGTGDAFMTSEFQQTLEGNPMLSSARDVHYGDRITAMHKGTNVYLHSHVERWPLKYDDGRISSQGQQVTGYPHNDTNNIWEIFPATELPEDVSGDAAAVRHGDIIRLLHVNTQSYLLAHDVASPLMPTNEEFTTWPWNDTSRYNDTLFELQIEGVNDKQNIWKSKSSLFRLIHVPTRVSMWTHAEPLPEWGFQQQEINGNKNALDKTALWYVDDLHPDEKASDHEERLKPLPPRKRTHMNFFRKFFELQLTMLHQNSQLTSSHPYASNPINWPFLITGISFWTENDTQKQIYMIGNVISWWAGVLSISIYCGVMAADALARRRGIYPIPSAVRSRMINSVGFFVATWAFHYLPFFVMNRQLFVHHYLPAHVISCLVTGAIFNFVGTETVNFPISRPGPLLKPGRVRPVMRNVLGKRSRAVCGAFVGALIIVFWWLSPLTYGTPGLSSYEVHQRKLLTSWTLHFAK